MWNEPLPSDLQDIPKLYGTEEILLADKIVHQHFFIGSSDWYVIEYDGLDLFFGFVILNGDIQNAEFGYFTLSELKSVKLGFVEIDRDLFWKKQPVAYIDKIQEALWHHMPAKKKSPQENCENF